MKPETFARALIVVVFLVVMAALSFGYSIKSDRIVLTGNMPEKGGWQPGVMKAKAGEPLELHLTSNDVVHGFAIGQMTGTEVEVLPGKFTNLTVTFSEPGTYTYYCTRWCGPNHWRMRGTIEVEGATLPEEETGSVPLYLQLGIDIDAKHPAQITPSGRPSAEEGMDFLKYVPGQYLTETFVRSNSPDDLFSLLRGEAALSTLSDDYIWDLVGLLYWTHTSKEELAAAEQLYADNCAACHGVNGQGDGVFAGADAQQETPTDFTNPEQMLGASSALLQGKIIRGGMGTGMPYWGPIFTEEQTWSLVNYLWSMQFDYPVD